MTIYPCQGADFFPAMQDCQIQIPPSFAELHSTGTRSKPDWAAVAERHELCEDMAQLLTEQAHQVWVKLGITEADVLRRMLQGLLADEARLSELEALWVVCRLAELQQWPLPADLADPLGETGTEWLHRQRLAACPG
ncbi:MAG TPA: ATPase with chaperone activity [Macromonas sp.]|nr:ATPase with chaperone activity [Macromonas sp.]